MIRPFYYRIIVATAVVLSFSMSGLEKVADAWDLTILHTNSLNGALDNCG